MEKDALFQQGSCYAAAAISGFPKFLLASAYLTGIAICLRILSKQPYYTTLTLLEALGKNETVRGLADALRLSMKRNPDIKENEIEEIESFSDKELRDVAGQLIRDKNEGKVTEGDVKNDEYIALKNASVYGHPPEHTGRPSKFEVERRRVREIRVGVERVEYTVHGHTHQNTIGHSRSMGYRRMVAQDSGQLVKTFYQDDGGNSWFSGIETLGEGIFIRLKDGVLPSQAGNKSGKHG